MVLVTGEARGVAVLGVPEAGALQVHEGDVTLGGARCGSGKTGSRWPRTCRAWGAPPNPPRSRCWKTGTRTWTRWSSEPGAEAPC